MSGSKQGNGMNIPRLGRTLNLAILRSPFDGYDGMRENSG
jgi:hypothetical protein